MPKGIYQHKLHSEMAKRKMSLSHKGKKPYQMNDKIRKKISTSRLGKKLSEETKKRISEAHKGEKHWNWKGGKRQCISCKKNTSSRSAKYCKNCFNKIPVSEETKQKISKALWNGGIEKSRLRLKQWRKDNNSRVNFWTSQRRKRLKNVIGSHNFGEWETIKAQYNWTCPHCNKQEPQIKLTQDHIIPISKGGSNNIDNIQPLCGRCNSKKSAKILINLRKFIGNKN